MPPTPFHPRHETPFKSSISSSQQLRKRLDDEQESSSSSHSNQWPIAISASKLDSRHWTYLAEGGKNLLLRYDGPSVYPFVGPSGRRVSLRLRKADRKVTQVEHRDEDEIDTMQWSETVLKPDLDSCGVMPILLRVQDNSPNNEGSKAFVRQMAAKIESFRPAERRKKSGLDETSQSSIFVTEDLSTGIEEKRVICFEVKPKCGFLPTANTELSPETKHVKSHFSRYRMHRVLKSHPMLPSLEDFESFYDPLDLYSGQTVRVKKAANALYRDWLQVQGNLRIFVDGRQVNGADVGHVDEIIQTHFSVNSTSDLFGNVLASKDVQIALQRLVQLQERYDDLDVEGVASIYEKETGKKLVDADEEPVSLEEYQDAIRDKNNKQTSSRQAIAKLLLSTMYKDCSIFVRNIAGQDPTIHLVDLDPKPITKLAYLYQLDQEICRSFQEWSHQVGLI